MSNRSGAAARSLNLNTNSDQRTVQARSFSDEGLARVAGPELSGAAVDLNAMSTTSAFGLDLSGLEEGMVLRCGCPGCVKASKGADSEAPAAPGPKAADDIPDDTSSNVVLDVNPGDTITTQIDHPGDHDYFQVNLKAGVTYEFTIDPTTEGEAAVDPIINVYDADGNFVTQYDTTSNGGTEDFDFMSEKNGLYYIDVGAYNDASVGGYSITGEVDNEDPDPYAGKPMDATDWGTRVDTDGVTNADGDEVIHVYFAKPGEVTPHPLTDTNVNSGWKDFEKEAAFVSFTQYENVINIDFVEVDSQEEADFIFGISPNAPALLGAMNPPGNEPSGAAWFNNAGVGWDEEGLAQGGFGFITFTHELGHGMGMAHPHDNGGDSMIMHGVQGETDSGHFNLNQGIHTVMTYNDGWPDGPHGESPSYNYGYQGTLMAFDVKVMQDRYGANMDYKAGDDVYTLPSQNHTGEAGGPPATMYSCLWDAGGNDTIVAGDGMHCNIDLRDATLRYEVGGGGWVSYARDIHGGFTIANGVTIENATGGAGEDRITGNESRNVLLGEGDRDKLFGHDGNDVVGGGLGRDVLFGGQGSDRLTGGEGRDFLRGGSGADRFIFDDGDIDRGDKIVDLQAADIVDLSRIDADINRGGDQDFTLVEEFTGAAGEATLEFDTEEGVTRLKLDTDGDGLWDAFLAFKGDQTDYAGFTGLTI